MSTLMDPHNAHLPRELYGEIIAYFSPQKDKRTLCDLALVSPTLRAESQRVLFRRMTDDWHMDAQEEKDAVESRHRAFLLAIVTNPERLGPYVRTYAQVRHFQRYQDVNERLKSRPPLWNLTLEVLPAMINLKQLYMEPCLISAEVRTSIASWKFQLESLTWMMPHDLAYLLRSQRSLQHLELGWANLNEDGLRDVPHSLCPALTSASGSICTLKNLAKHRPIVAFYATKMSRADSKVFRRANRSESALMLLEYLSLELCRSFNKMNNSFRLNVKLLELRWWSWERLGTIDASSFPKLQVLVLQSTVLLTATRIPEQEIVQGVADIFQRLPTLNYVVINRGIGAYYYSSRYSRVENPVRPLDISSGEYTNGVRAQVTSMMFRIDKELGSIWWKTYTLFPSYVAA